MLSFDAIVAHFKAKREGPQFKARCPAHDDRKASLAIDTGDHGATIFHCHAGCATADVLTAASLSWQDVLPPENGHDPIVAAYDYRDVDGTLLYQVLRFEPKSFRQRKPDGDAWAWKLGTVKRVLYRLPDLQNADTVWLVEGEKDADRLVALGLAATTVAGGAQAWRKPFAKQLKDANVRCVFVVPDNDEPGRQFARTVVAACLGEDLIAKAVELPSLPEKGDVSDYLNAGHSRADLEACARAPRVATVDSAASFLPASLSMADAYRLSKVTPYVAVQRWGLPAAGNGEPLQSLSNIGLILANDPVFVGRVHYDSFLDKLLLHDREWQDVDDVGAAMYFHSHVQMRKVSPGQVREVLTYLCKQHPRHCVRDWLATLIWDGVPRVDTALEDYWGVEDFVSHPQDYVRAISRNFLLGLVARVERPGCKLDTMPVFEGTQGVSKSTALEVLASSSWFSVARDTVGTKDFLLTTRGKLIIEIAELDAFSKAEITAIKNTMSTAKDTYRPPYARSAQDFPRQCVFAGTTNKDEWATDPTGGRRFWPIKCGTIRLDLLADARDQLYAEAAHRVRAGEPWWLTPASTASVQRDRHADDVWTGTVLTWLMGKADATSIEVLLGALRFRESDIGRREQNRVGDILRHAGWKRQTIRREGLPVKAWVSPLADERADDTTVTFP